jgi:hypothetical protein
LNLVAGRLAVPKIESRCSQLKLGHPLLYFPTLLAVIPITPAGRVTSGCPSIQMKWAYLS